MNDQTPEPLISTDDQVLDVHSLFFTIQGEGPFSGHRAIFVRLAGCNLQCPGCDTLYTKGRRFVAVAALLLEIQKIATVKGLLIVITGGEPLRQPIGLFVSKLLTAGYKVQIESNGMFAPDEILAELLIRRPLDLVLVVSPKTPKINRRSALLAGAFKYVLDHASIDQEDGLPITALEYHFDKRVARPPMLRAMGAKTAPIYLSPFDTGDEISNAMNQEAVAKSAMKFGYIAGVQLHKILRLA